MSIRVTAYGIKIGEQQRLEIAQGEDREFRLTFDDPLTGAPRDMTNANAATMTVRSRDNGVIVLSRSFSGFYGNASSGTLRFQILAYDTVSVGDGPYDVTVEWTDSNNYTEQLLVVSTFDVLKGGLPTGITAPSTTPVVYGLNWWPSGYPGLWSSISGGYQYNDAVQAYDGSFGATAISTFRSIGNGVTGYPMTGTVAPVVASGWAYVAQHGAVGTYSSVGVTSLDIDWSMGDVFTKTISTSSVVTFSNSADGKVVVVVITSGVGNTVTWPSVKWAGGTPPTQTSSGTDVYTFVKVGSTMIYGSAVQAMS